MATERKTIDDTPIPYTASPLQLLWGDVCLIFRNLRLLRKIVSPLRPCLSGTLDELGPSWENWFGVAVHVSLFILQIAFLLSLPICLALMVPAAWVIVYIAAVLVANNAVCNVVLNGKQRFLVSKGPSAQFPGHEREHWIFINGVSVGHHWMQSNLDRLAQTFGRKVTGVLNPTYGIIFDLIQCLIQRDFAYATQDVRDAYPYIKKALLNPQFDKVVLIVHSQGGIEAGLVIDWLLAEMPQEILQHLEVYTFGNAANHWNNPNRTLSTDREDRPSIPYIEHYANSEDFVSVLGVLNYTPIPNRYMGQLFVRSGPGHLLNQHYLNTMFPLGSDGKVMSANGFMNTQVTTDATQTGICVIKERERRRRQRKALRVKDLSRLWMYRNGGSPPEDHLSAV
ncbi:hypothetical protein MPDQ_007443 [Monascus purpureus]|uniref:DUF676 domain-containing protein n=1 Tax=Monascus purpureus TaxID=5098 RepID=A0A507QW79_MONPU|nr:hypothetical protein MPDQ_007443 [Monascus purpureus]